MSEWPKDNGGSAELDDFCQLTYHAWLPDQQPVEHEPASAGDGFQPRRWKGMGLSGGLMVIAGVM